MKKLYYKIKDKVIDIINMYRQVYLDYKNHKIYKQTLDEEFADRESEFVKRNLKYDPDTYYIIYMLKIPAEFQESGQDYLINDKLNESTFFITDFLKNTVGFREYVSGIPDYYHVEDPASDDVSLTYIAMWNFTPMVTSVQKQILFGVPAAIIATITALLLFI